MINKEYACDTCGDFEGIAPVCPRCGRIGKRAFRTPVGVATGKAKDFDRQFEALVRDRGLSNYSTVDRNKLTWEGKYTADVCQGQWAKPGVAPSSTGRRDASVPFQEYAQQPFEPPKFQHGAIQTEAVVKRGLPTELVERTRNKFTDPRGDPKI